MGQQLNENAGQSTADQLEKQKRMVMQGILSEQLLHRQNQQFDGTGGVSENNREMGFVPAFQDTDTDSSVVSRFADGRPAPVHVLDGLPEDWITARDEKGNVLSVRDSVVAGFICAGRFYTREEAAIARSERDSAD